MKSTNHLRGLCVVVLGLIGCPEDVPESTCSADCNGALAAAPNSLCAEFDPAVWVGGNVSCTSTCQVDVSECTAASSAEKAEFETCTGATPGIASQGDCETGLDCVPLLEDGAGYCLRSCATAGESEGCGDGLCIDLSSVGLYCFKHESVRDGECLDNLSWCLDDAGDCIYTSYDSSLGGYVNPRCKIKCDGATLGQQGTCADGETCIKNPEGWYEAEDDVACSGDADCSEGYSCVELSAGFRCIKWTGWCGNEVPLCGKLGESGRGSCAREEGYVCTPSPYNGHDHCAITGLSTDRTEDSGDAFFSCVGVGNGLGVCVGGCETDAGDANCGEGYECVVPELTETPYWWVLQRDASNEYISCDTEADDCSEGFSCVNFRSGPFCARGGKHCKVIDEGSGSSSTEVEEGREGGLCYESEICNVGLECVGGTCFAVGAESGVEGGPCYANGTCNSGLQCTNGVCVVYIAEQGENGGTCFENGTCDTGLTCVDGVCALPALSIAAISPNWGYADSTTAVSITGDGFEDGLLIKLGATDLTDIAVTGTQLISATVPAQMPVGTYTLTVIRADQEVAFLVDAFEIRAATDP